MSTTSKEKESKKQYFCDYSDEEIDKMSEKRLNSIKKCQKFDCFDCRGDCCY